MGNLSTTAISPADAFTQIQAWITSAAPGLAWTLYDTISAGADVVFSCPGVTPGTRPPLYVRMTVSLKDEAKDPQGMHDNVTFRLYRSWDTGTHTGKGEVGRIGPHLFLTPGWSPNYWNNAVFNTAKPEYTRYSDYVYPVYPIGSGQHSNLAYNGRGYYFIDNPSNRVWYYDIAQNTYALLTTPGWAMNAQCILTVDAQGREFIWTLRYYISGVAPLGNYWYVYDVLNDTWTAKADPPWSGSYTGMTNPWVWDGGDYIYVAYGGGSNGGPSQPFSRYSISANTWTALATMPSWFGNYINHSFASVGENQKMYYVPAAVSGHDHDEIYFIPPYGSDTNWARYDVTDDEWSAPGGNFPALPVAKTNYRGGMLWFDSTKGANGAFVVCMSTNTVSDQLYIMDVAAGTFGSRVWQWGAAGDIWNNADYQSGATACMRRNYFGTLRLPTTSATLSLVGVGNGDGFSIVATWTPTGGSAQIQRFATVGFYNSYMKTDMFTTTAPISAGTAVSIAHNGVNTGKLAVGDWVEIYDQNAAVQPQLRGQTWTPGGGESCVITNIPDPQHIIVESVVGSYSTGVLLGQDIASAVVGNDDMHFGCLRGEYGYQPMGEADYYVAQPVISAARGTAPGRRNVAILSTLQLYNPNTLRPDFNTVGELPNLWSQNPLANPNDTDTLNGHPYFVFSPFLRKRLVDTRGYELGPTDG